MMTQMIAGKTYEQRECYGCRGAGSVHDATNADKVCTGGKTVGACNACRGKGYTLHLLGTAPAAPKREVVEVGEIPAWMC